MPPPPPPTPLSIATNALSRLLKEESSYETELAAQKLRVRKLREQQGKGEGGAEGESEDVEENSEWRVRQEVSRAFLWVFSLGFFILGCFLCFLFCFCV